MKGIELWCHRLHYRARADARFRRQRAEVRRRGNDDMSVSLRQFFLFQRALESTVSYVIKIPRVFYASGDYNSVLWIWNFFSGPAFQFKLDPFKNPSFELTIIKCL